MDDVEEIDFETWCGGGSASVIIERRGTGTWEGEDREEGGGSMTE
jgi:hypothetical protein